MTKIIFITRSLVSLLLAGTAAVFISCDNGDGEQKSADADSMTDSSTIQNAPVLDAGASHDSAAAQKMDASTTSGSTSETYTPSQMAFCNSPCMQSVMH